MSIFHCAWIHVAFLGTLLAGTLGLAQNAGNEYARRAQSLMLEHREQDSLPLWRQAIAAESASAVYHNLYGLALQATGQQELARQEFQRAIRLSPALVAAHSNLGYSFWLNGEETAAAHEFAVALKLRPKDLSLRLANGLLSTEVGDYIAACKNLDLARPWPTDNKNLFVIISAYASCGQISKAIEAASALPRDLRTGLQIGQLFLALHQPAAAIHILRSARDDNPSSSLVRVSLAEAYLNTRDLESALQELDQISASELNSADALELRATCLRLAGRRDEAQGIFRKLTLSFPDDPASYVNATQILLEDQRWDEALELLNAGLSRIPNNWLLLFRRGMTLKLAGQYTEAQKDLVRSLQSGGDTLLISAGLGDIYAIRGDLKGAAELFRMTFQKTDAPEFQLAYALALARQGEDVKALPQFAAATRRMPRNARCHFEYGKLLRRSGKDQQARREFELARSLDPNFASNLYALGRLYHTLGERDLEANTMRDFVAARQKESLER